jgi:hypothetical protein
LFRAFALTLFWLLDIESVGGEWDGDGGDWWVEGVTGEGSCVFRECKWIVLVISEGGGSGVVDMTTCTRDDVKNTEGTSWGFHISQSDFTA